jgi:hypothetical protein
LERGAEGSALFGQANLETSFTVHLQDHSVISVDLLVHAGEVMARIAVQGNAFSRLRAGQTEIERRLRKRLESVVVVEISENAEERGHGEN